MATIVLTRALVLLLKGPDNYNVNNYNTGSRTMHVVNLSFSFCVANIILRRGNVTVLKYIMLQMSKRIKAEKLYMISMVMYEAL